MDKPTNSVEECISEIGLSLKGAREAKQLTLDQVHAETRVSYAKLKLIEQGDFDTLGDEVFVQGYIRRFAKAVEADADRLVGAYRSCVSGSVIEPSDDKDEQNVVSEHPSENVLNVRLKANNRAWFIAAVPFLSVVIILALLVLFSSKKDSNSSDVYSSPTGADFDVGEVLDDQELPANAVVEYSVDAPEAISELHSSSEVLNNNGGAASSRPLSDRLISSSNTGGLPDEPTAITSVDDRQAIDGSMQASGVSDSVGGESMLELSFVDECWIEVRDKNNQLVFADLRNSGDNLRLFGEAPLNVMLGNVHAVAQLKLDGIEIAVEPIGTRKTLRLRLDTPN